MNVSTPVTPEPGQPGQRATVFAHALDAACFAFFALSLCVPSGYSYGSTALALLTLAGSIAARPKGPARRETLALVGLMLVLGLLWSLSFDRWFSAAGWGYGAKYALASLSLWYLSKSGVRLSAIVWGLALGCAGALAIAIYQAGVLKMPRVSGFTNAIQYGGIAMYLGFATLSLALLGHWSKSRTATLGVLGAFGVCASFLSDSRGSWVVIPLLIAAIWLMAWLNGYRRLASMAAAGMLILGLIVAVPTYQKLEQRSAEAAREVSQYLKDPQQYAMTSVGQRLEQWRLAIHLIEQRPFSGWGLAGYPAAKKQMVDQGLAHPSVMEFGHAHNEILDMWVKRGLPGLILLLAFYAVPAAIFWPTPRRLARANAAQRSSLLALRAAATLLPFSFLYLILAGGRRFLRRA